jgi:hypothetical protein
LQSTPSLVATPVWGAATGTFVVANGRNHLIVSPPVGNRYYRLYHP